MEYANTQKSLLLFNGWICIGRTYYSGGYGGTKDDFLQLQEEHRRLTVQELPKKGADLHFFAERCHEMEQAVAQLRSLTAALRNVREGTSLVRYERGRIGSQVERGSSHSHGANIHHRRLRAGARKL